MSEKQTVAIIKGDFELQRLDKAIEEGAKHMRKFTDDLVKESHKKMDAEIDRVLDVHWQKIG